MLYISVSVCL